MKMRILPAVLLVFVLLATETPARRGYYLPNNPEAICITLTRNVVADFKQNSPKASWDFEESSKFLKGLLGRDNPHVTPLAPVIMVSARRMYQGLQTSINDADVGRVVVETWGSCVEQIENRLNNPGFRDNT